MAVADALATRLESILGLLPQTQCGACQYPGCRPFAEALDGGAAPVDACTPGGALLARRLSVLLDRPLPALANAVTATALPAPLLAVIREAECIGCTKCIAPCPVDAIVGAAKQLHTVITEACTGCGLCLPPCPVDCIELSPAPIESVWPLADSPAAIAAREGADIAACTACGDCATVCPSALAPASLAQVLSLADAQQAATLGLERCTECGDCARICGEVIPLTAYFIQGKAMLTASRWQETLAVQSQARTSRRHARLAAGPRIEQDYVAPPVDTSTARDELAAVMARARQRRAENPA